MIKKSRSILVVFWLLVASNSYGQLGQISTVIGMASKYASLLQSSQNNVIYADENLEEEITEHTKIAIIPFNTMISYIKPPEYSEEEAENQFENQQMVGKLMQEQFWDVFDNYHSEIYLQDIRVTNKILQDIGYFYHPGDFPPSYLAELLQVDAVLICTYDLQIDNQKTGWQNLSKALSDLAMSQIKGSIPGVQALQFIKNPNAILDVITKPGEFYQKLKSGDISAIANIAGSLLPEGNWKKIAEIAVKNSKTIAKVAKGDTSNLFSDLVSNNASLLGSELNLNPQIVNLIQSNSKTVQKVMEGNTKGIMFDLISNNVGAITNKYVGEQNSFLATTIGNNTNIIAKLATGDTSNLLENILDNNIGLVTSKLGGNDASFYANLINKNKGMVSKVLKGDFTSLTTDLLANNMSLIGEKLPLGEAQKYAELLSNKEAVKGLLSGNTQSIIQTLTTSGVELFGDKIGGADVQKFAKIIANNKDFLQSAINGDSKQMLNSLLSKESNFLGTALNSAQLGKFGEILNNNSDIIVKLANGDTDNLLQSTLNNNIGTITGSIVGKSSNVYTEIISKNSNLIGKALSGDYTSLTTDLLTNNMSFIGETLPLEDAQKYSALLSNKDAIKGLLSGDTNAILATLTENGAKLFGDQIQNVDVQKFATLLGNNKNFINDAISGDPKKLLGSLLNKDNNILGAALDKNQMGEFGDILLENSDIITKLASGDTDSLLKDTLSNNINRLVGSLGDENASFYSNMLMQNKDNISNIMKNDFSGLLTTALSNSTSMFNGKLPAETASKYTSILTNKDAINTLLTLDEATINQNLQDNGSQLFGENIAGLDIKQLSSFINNNKDLITDINSGNTQKIVTSLLKQDRNLFGKPLNFSQINELSTIIGSTGNILEKVFGDNTPKGTLNAWFIGLNTGLDNESISKASDLLLDKNGITALLKGDKTQLKSLLGNDDNAEKTAGILINNTSKINRLLGIAEDEDFTILNKTPEEIEVIAYKISQNKDVLNGIIKGDTNEIANGYSDTDLKEDLGIAKGLYTQISKGLTKEQKNVAQVIVNSKINQMLLNEVIDLQFFDFGEDALSERYDNVSLREKTFSQTTASILDPTLDPKDFSKFTINIFTKDSDKVMWQYINENKKTRIYDMSKTVANVIKRLNKSFPYFVSEK